MRRTTLATMTFLCLACATVPMAAAPAAAPSPASAGFEKLKALQGTWESKTPEGEPVTVTYSLVSGGNTVMERLSHGDMVTMYHLDGDSILLTHYCMANNEPRMRSKGLSADGRTLDFKFVDAANLASPADMHMRALKVTLLDADHLTEEWVHSAGGKETPATFTFTRRK